MLLSNVYIGKNIKCLTLLALISLCFYHCVASHTQLHQDFVSTVFEIGVRHATPNAIVKLMTPNIDITNERVKSHLQRYRLNIGKSRKEFKSKFNGIYCSINARDKESETAPSVCSTINGDNHLQKIYLPRLTAEEKDTPIGQAFEQVIGLMQNLTVQLEANRHLEAREVTGKGIKRGAAVA